MFVQISLLKDYSASLPNRGLDGLAKRVAYGDEMRQRISSQCIKAAVRMGQPMTIIDDLGNEVVDDMRSLAERLEIGMSYRSRRVFDTVVAPQLTAAFGSETEAGLWCRALADLFLKPGGAGDDDPKKQKKEKGENGEVKENASKPYLSGYMDQPVVIGQKEVEAIIAAAKVLREVGVKADGQTGGSDLRSLFERRGAAKKVVKTLVAAKTIPADKADETEKTLENAISNIRAVREHAGLDGALFGRMTTGSVVSRVESCVHVAHAITVHQIQANADYFSVQDNLQAEDETGASHTNHTEIASGLFYQYAVIDVRQVTQNFSGLSSEQQAEIVSWLVRAFYASECSAKRGSTAGYGAGLYYLAEIGRRQPRTLAAAFQKSLLIKDRNDDRPMWRRAVSALDEHRDDLNLKGGAPAASYDTEDLDIRNAARATNGAAFEVIADRVKVDVLSWLQTQQVPVQAAAE